MGSVKRKTSGAAKMEETDDNKSTLTTWNDIWMDYCDHSTMTGIRQIGNDTPFAMRRCIWVVLLIGGCIGFCYQAFCCVTLYLAYPITSNLDIKYDGAITFPAVTICNLNNFRISAAADYNWHHSLNTVVSRSRSPFLPMLLSHSPDNDTIQLARDKVSRRLRVDEVFTKSAHKIEDLLISCKYGQEDCFASDFTIRYTPEGICYTFNGHNDSRKVYREGSFYGLHLLLNIEQYEYMSSLAETAGVKVTLHDQLQYQGHKGFIIGPGQHSFVEADRTAFLYMKEPHGDCYQNSDVEEIESYTRYSCQTNLMASDIIKRCKCRDFWMKEVDGIEPCNITRYESCVQKIYNSERTATQSQCPVACKETIYDPFISTTAISRSYVKSVLKGNYSHFLRKKLIKARESFEHFDYEQHRHNKDIINEFTSALRQIKLAYTRIQDQTSKAMSYIKDVMNEITPRLNFHLSHVLPYIQQMIQLNFVRGWEITDERTLRHVTSRFYETISMYDKTISQLLAISVRDEPKRQILHMLMERDLSEQLELAIRAVDNLTRVHYAFKNGQSFHWFDITPEGAYDQFIIPNHVLSHDPQSQKNYYNVLSDHLAGYIEELLVMKRILSDVYQTSYLNNTAYIKTRDQFSEHSREINNYKFLLYEKIILRAKEIWAEKLDAVKNVNMSFNLQKYNIFKTIVHLNKTAASALDKVNNHILPVLAKAINYIKDVSKSKHDLAEEVTSKYFQDLFQSFIVDVTEVLKSQGRDLEVTWHTLESTVQHIWATMASEAATRRFYTAMMEDLLIQSTNLNFSQPLLDMAGIEGSNNTDTATFNQLVHRLNADISVINLSNKSHDIEKVFSKYRKDTNVIETINNHDKTVLSAYNNLFEDMNNFVQGNNLSDSFIGDNFLRMDIYMTDLRYFQVEQKASYPLPALLGDLGGSLALFLGMSILTICELVDFLLHGAAYYQDIQRQAKQQQQVHYHYYDSSDLHSAPSNESRTSIKSQTGNGHPGDYKLGSGDSYV